MDELKAYEKETTCIKCGSNDIVDHYYKKKQLTHSLNNPDGYYARREHIHRRCRNCHYFWNEKPLDEQEG